MEAFPVGRDPLDTPPQSSSVPSTRRTSRASSSSKDPSRADSHTNEDAQILVIKSGTSTFRIGGEMSSELLSGNNLHITQDSSSTLQASKQRIRPSMARYHTTDGLQAPARSPESSPASSRASPSSRRHSPSLHYPRDFLYPPKGEVWRRAASLDDLPHTNSRQSKPTMKDIPPLPFDLPVPPSSPHSTSPATSFNQHASSTSQHGVRRWHALMELVSTEDGYVKDLKILVRIYIAQLSSVVLLETDAHADIARNAEALLWLHKKILRRLNKILEEEEIRDMRPKLPSDAALRKLENAINKVASIFIKEAASFQLYEAFCAGHSHALDLIRQVQTLPEWDMYEKRCAVIVADKSAQGVEIKSPVMKPTPAPTNRPSTPFASRRYSTDVAPVALISLPKTSKLTLCDFLIKPIQRICRYPLMLGQLLVPGPTPVPIVPTPFSSAGAMPNSGFEVQALEVMKQVAARVDEARKKADVAIRSKLVIERVSDSPLPQLISLGPCLLAGSLDIIYHHEIIAPLTTPIKVKYLGAFLYGGWLLFVKVHKNRTYEPRHWFPLAVMYMKDIPEDDALLPSSFRLSSGQHHFEVAAACSQEKTLWMDHIKKARVKSLLRVRELPSSLEESEGGLKPSSPTRSTHRPSSRKMTAPPPSGSTAAPTEDIMILPPKRRSSLGALEFNQIYLDNLGLAILTAEPLPQLPDSVSSPNQTTPSHDEATPSQIRRILEGEASTILIRRASANHRKMVDQSLGDVFFEECQSVRVQAQMKEPLFQPPKLSTESGSALAARNKMTRRESILLRRQRSVVDAGSTGSISKPSASSKFALSRNKSAHAMGSAKEMRRRTLAIPSFSFFEREEDGTRDITARPSTATDAPFAQPPTPTLGVTPDEDDAQNDGIFFSIRRHRAKRASRLADEVVERAPERAGFTSLPSISDGVPSAPLSVPELDMRKELPPIPKVKRRSTIRPFSLARSRSDDGRARPSASLRRSSDARMNSSPLSVYVVGQGISNIGPEPQATSKSRLHPGSFLRKSLTLITQRHKRASGGYLGSLFNRSSVSVARDNESRPSSHSQAATEPHSLGSRRISASTPVLQDSLTNWELIPDFGLLNLPNGAPHRATSQSSNGTDLDAVSAKSISSKSPKNARPSSAVSSLRRRSTRMVQSLRPLSQVMRSSS
ncbi:hypothetical protein FRC19_011101 [Serendipita sp. 401]|nr:hypothetical protein FRC19_011101 [Serendipita sp. 401]